MSILWIIFNMKEKIRRCKSCGSEVKIKTGLHNWKSLFKKPTLEEGITFFIIIILIVSAYTYKSDLNSIINYYENESYCDMQRNINIQGETNPSSLINPISKNLINPSNLSINDNG